MLAPRLLGGLASVNASCVQPCLRDWTQPKAAGAQQVPSDSSPLSQRLVVLQVPATESPGSHLPLPSPLFAPETLGSLTHLLTESLIHKLKCLFNAPSVPGSQLETGDPAMHEPQLPKSPQSRGETKA